MTDCGVPPGVKMPKKKDPHLRNLQQPQQRQFFDSADYEVRRYQAQRQTAPLKSKDTEDTVKAGALQSPSP
ncbi:hypothetical protein ERJ75_001829400 [Trypanosoma vivax]|uniref:Uncharacterized protein n=1 Tax=Trypanosoma vivax (strain Y486) TaxID=1055687 RepID=G0U935_TRYVY|nr:hypothetical protein ERJ75_001829400 [Trypanosoma vivax]CCC54119.1 conserved hypothetical protein [Trypanosoma vivax Y486]